jgi:hypothetical protein
MRKKDKDGKIIDITLLANENTAHLITLNFMNFCSVEIKRKVLENIEQ